MRKISLSFPWRKMAGPAAVIVVGSLVVSCAKGCSEHYDAEQETKDKLLAYTTAVSALSQVTHEENVYVLTGPNTVGTKESNITYLMNFQTALVSIDGPDNADSIVPMSQEGVRNLAEMARQQICAHSKSDPAKNPAMDDKFGDKDSKKAKADILATRKVFVARHCHPEALPG